MAKINVSPASKDDTIKFSLDFELSRLEFDQLKRVAANALNIAAYLDADKYKLNASQVVLDRLYDALLKVPR